jgi:DNA-binding response OmpR family regulator
MSNSGRTLNEPRIIVAAGPALLARLRRLLPEADILESGLEELPRRTRELRPRVILCGVDDVGAGLEALTSLRKARSDARTLLLTPAAAVEERLAALDAGVDDAVAEPISDVELAGRLRHQLKRARVGRVTRLSIGADMQLDLDRRELLRDGEWVHLRPKEASLLELFARAPGRALTREHILSRVWGPGHAGDPRTVDVHVRWLRSKIEPDPRDPVRLLTVRGVGYRLEPAPLTER